MAGVEDLDLGLDAEDWISAAIAFSMAGVLVMT